MGPPQGMTNYGSRNGPPRTFSDSQGKVRTTTSTSALHWHSSSPFAFSLSHIPENAIFGYIPFPPIQNPSISSAHSARLQCFLTADPTDFHTPTRINNYLPLSQTTINLNCSTDISSHVLTQSARNVLPSSVSNSQSTIPETSLYRTRPFITVLTTARTGHTLAAPTRNSVKSASVNTVILLAPREVIR
jgi:hypothetical protein